ncbi:PKD domain-containing protein [Flavobacterium hydatis]|nr:PKD domain-containing protein [Flavobacterium hydatis]
MMKKTLQSITALFFIFFLSCSSENEMPKEEPTALPTADFSFKVNETTTPKTIVFENKSTNATEYLWDFGDKTTSSEKNPSHSYTAAGTYLVKLTATGAGGKATTTNTVIIAAPPVATTVKITKVTVTKMPFMDYNGNRYESAYIRFHIVDKETYMDQVNSEIFKNISKTQLPFTWTLTEPKVIKDLSIEYEFSISKIEGAFGNTIGGSMFAIMKDYTTGANAYPKTITLNYIPNNPIPFLDSQNVTLILDVTWQ